MKKAAILALTCFSLSSSAQELLSSGGASTTSNFSLGEFSISTIQDSNNYLTQGFQQTTLSAVTIESTEMLSDLKLFPNPTNEFIRLDWGVNIESCTLTVSDVFGRVIKNKSYEKGKDFYVGDLPGGEYFVRAVFNETDFKSFKVTIVK